MYLYSMFICMHGCMYVGSLATYYVLYVCTHGLSVCLYVRTYVRMSVLTYSRYSRYAQDICMHSCVYVCLSVCMYLCLSVCMSVCLSVWVSASVSAWPSAGCNRSGSGSRTGRKETVTGDLSSLLLSSPWLFGAERGG